MRLLIQRVREGHVAVEGTPFASIGTGYVVLAGFCGADVDPALTPPVELTRLIERMTDKLLGLRVFSDADGKMNCDIATVDGQILLISQFTLYADCRQGRRPSLHMAAPGPLAEPAYEQLVAMLERKLPGKLKTGKFGADMDVCLVNQGPVTILLDSDELGWSEKSIR